MTSQRQFGAIVVGGGPAGLAILLSAHRDGTLRGLLQRGVLMVERSATIGKGSIGDYVINSDSTGDTFVDPLRAGGEAALHRLLETPVAKRIASVGTNSVPLHEVGALMALIGQVMHTIIREYPQSAVLTSYAAASAQLMSNGLWQLIAIDKSGHKRIFESRQVILATGAAQPWSRLEQECVAGVPIAERWGNRLMQSGKVLSVGGLSRVAKLLSARSDPKVAILGGSTSAMAVAHALLHRLPKVRFAPGGITLFHRRPLRVYYTSPEEAIADGYTEFHADDLCPVTNRVYRLAGFRLDSRDLLMQVRGIGGRPPEPRLRLHLLQFTDPEALELIDSADLVVAALGYRPNALCILNHDAVPIRLFAQTNASAPLVDSQCRVLDEDSHPIPGLFGIGLAAGFVPYGKFGGEPSFSGQANGLWLWQNGVGSIIVNALLAPVSITSAHGDGATPVTWRRSNEDRSGERAVLINGTGG